MEYAPAHLSPPALVLMKGHPGTGKSTLAEHLSRLLGCPLIDKDATRDCLTRFGGVLPQAELNELSYAVMFRHAALQLKCGLSCIVDSPLARVELYHRAQALAAEFAVQRIAIIECETRDVGEWKKRIEQRSHCEAHDERSHKPCDWAQLQRLLSRYEGCDAWTRHSSVELVEHVVVDTSHTGPADLAQQVAHYLSKCSHRSLRA